MARTAPRQPRQHPALRDRIWEHTFFATPLPLVGRPLFATPVGFAPVVLVVVLALGLRLIVGAVSTVAKTRGVELPVADRVPSRAMVRFWSWNWGGNASAPGI